MLQAYTISGMKISALLACKQGREDQYFCGCGDRLILKCGREKRPHFAHPPGSPHAISRHGDKVDSKAHMDMEEIVEQMLRRLCSNVEAEKRIVINGETYIPDLYAENCYKSWQDMKNNTGTRFNLIVEVQASNTDYSNVMRKIVAYSSLPNTYVAYILYGNTFRKPKKGRELLAVSRLKRYLIGLQGRRIAFLESSEKRNDIGGWRYIIAELDRIKDDKSDKPSRKYRYISCTELTAYNFMKAYTTIDLTRKCIDLKSRCIDPSSPNRKCISNDYYCINRVSGYAWAKIALIRPYNYIDYTKPCEFMELERTKIHS
jgi:hypothetical protein